MRYSKVVLFIVICIFCCFSLGGCSLVNSLMGIKEDSLITVTLDENGGQVDKKTFKGNAGDALELPTPTRDGYDFYGWCDEYQLYSEDVFPSSDTTLVARWQVREDREISVLIETTLNKSYKFDKGYIYFTYDAHKDWKPVIEYISYNKISKAKIVGNYEALYNNCQAGIMFGNVGYVKLCGSSRADVLYSQDITNIDGYKSFSFNFEVNPSAFVPASEDVFMNILVGSNNSTYDMYIRNISIEMKYTEIAGTIV